MLTEVKAPRMSGILQCDFGGVCEYACDWFDDAGRQKRKVYGVAVSYRTQVDGPLLTVNGKRYNLHARMELYPGADNLGGMYAVAGGWGERRDHLLSTENHYMDATPAANKAVRDWIEADLAALLKMPQIVPLVVESEDARLAAYLRRLDADAGELCSKLNAIMDSMTELETQRGGLARLPTPGSVAALVESVRGLRTCAIIGAGRKQRSRTWEIDAT
jgi:hypothetical protein